MTTESRSRFTQNYVPGLFACATESYKRYGELWREICVVKKSTKQYEESTYKSGFGLAVEKPEGTSITFDARIQGHTKRWVHKTYALGARITDEAIEDDLYGDMEDSMSELGISMAEKKQTQIADIFNSGFGTRLSGDGQYIFDTDHVRLDGSTYSNDATAADLGHASLWTAIEAFEALRDQRGKRINRQPTTLLVPPALEKVAAELLFTGKYPHSAENRINSLRRTADPAAADCKQCHRAHAPAEVKFGVSVPSKACGACHEQPLAELAATTAKHGALSCAISHREKHNATRECAGCHGRLHPAAIMARFPKCADCHHTAHDLNRWPEKK